MKRLISLLLLWTLILVSCSRNEPTATDLLAKLLASVEAPPMEIYFNGAVPEAVGYLSQTDSDALYEGHTPAKLSDEYALALCRDDRIYEVHLYHALDADRAEQIETILRRRQGALLKQENYLYDPDSPAAGSTVYRNGRWVCLLVTDDNQTAREILKDALQ